MALQKLRNIIFIQIICIQVLDYPWPLIWLQFNSVKARKHQGNSVMIWLACVSLLDNLSRTQKLKKKNKIVAHCFLHIMTPETVIIPVILYRIMYHMVHFFKRKTRRINNCFVIIFSRPLQTCTLFYLPDGILMCQLHVWLPILVTFL